MHNFNSLVSHAKHSKHTHRVWKESHILMHTCSRTSPSPSSAPCWLWASGAPINHTEAPEEMRDNSTTVLQTLIAECLIFLYSQQGRVLEGKDSSRKLVGQRGVNTRYMRRRSVMATRFCYQPRGGFQKEQLKMESNKSNEHAEILWVVIAASIFPGSHMKKAPSLWMCCTKDQNPPTAQVSPYRFQSHTWTSHRVGGRLITYKEMNSL